MCLRECGATRGVDLWANTLLKNYDLIFLPRAGIAYQLFGGRHGTVIRGAYGRYIFPTTLPEFANHQEANAPISFTFTQSYTGAGQAIDGLGADELLRYNDPVQFPVMGMNSAGAVNSSAGNSLLPGGIAAETTIPNSPPSLVTEANVTVEQALKGNSALRVSWILTHATNLPIEEAYNNTPTTYQWEMATGTTAPAGGASVIGTSQQNTYAATATRPYDQTTWGQNFLYMRSGWSNDNILEADYQRVFHHGVAYQISYDFSKPMRIGGNTSGGGFTTSSGEVQPYANFPGGRGSAVGTMISPDGPLYPGVAPPPLPTGVADWQDWHALTRYELYQLDSNEPIQHIRFSGIVDLPFGRGKRFFGNVNRFWNEVIGGFQVAGDGSIESQLFQVAGGDEGPAYPLHVYKHRYKVQDCRSGVCEKSYLWFNGYLAPTATQGVAGSNCTSACVTGLPANYQPYQAPIDNTPGTPDYSDNFVNVTLANGTEVQDTYDTGPAGSDYLTKSWFNGPINYTEDISLFKVFPIKEGMNLRFNADAFNALNVQGYNNPNTTTGLENMLSSHNTPRQIQLTMRLTF